MQNSEARGKKPIKEADKLHSRKAKLEYVSSKQIQDRNIDDKLTKIQSDWEKTFDIISDWITIVDLKGRILRTNRAGEDFTNLPRNRIQGQSCCKLIHSMLR